MTFVDLRLDDDVDVTELVLDQHEEVPPGGMGALPCHHHAHHGNRLPVRRVR